MGWGQMLQEWGWGEAMREWGGDGEKCLWAGWEWGQKVVSVSLSNFTVEPTSGYTFHTLHKA